MALDVNTEKWGNADEWTTNTSASGTYIKYDPSGRTYTQIYAAGIQSKNVDIDLSIAPWRIHSDSTMLNQYGNVWFNGWKDASGTVIDANQRGQAHNDNTPIIARKNSPFVMSYITGTTPTSYPNRHSKYWAYYSEGETLTGNEVGARRPITNFRYDKIKICPVTWFTDNELDRNFIGNISNVTQFGSIPTMDDISEEGKQFCFGFGFEVFVEINGTWTELPITIDIPTEYIALGDDSFSGNNGFKMLTHPHIQNRGGTHYNNMIVGQIDANDMVSTLYSRGSAVARENGFEADATLTSTSDCRALIVGKPTLFDWITQTEKKTATSVTVTWCSFHKVTGSSYDVFKSMIMRELAYIGLPFVLRRSDVALPFGNEGVYLPVFDSQRCTTGEYVNGADSLNLPNANWQWIYQLDVLPPDIPPQPNEEDSGDLNNHSSYLHRYANPNAVYALTEQNFLNFINDINGLYLSDPDDTQLKIDFKGSNPNEYIIGAYGIPFPPNYIVPTAPDDSIEIGPVTLPTAKGKLVDTSITLLRDCGTITIPKHYNDFRDYEPYTQIELYVPLCGSVKLDAALVVGYEIGVEVYYDILTLSATAAIYKYGERGTQLINTINGEIGANLPVTSSAMGSYQNAIKSTENAIKQNNMRIGTAAATTAIGVAGALLAPETGGLSLAAAGATIAGISAIAGNIGKGQQLEYELTHKQPDIINCSSANGAVAQWISDMRPWVFIKRARSLQPNDEIYSKTVGNACCITSTINDMHGRIVCSNIRCDNISNAYNESPTADEINSIKQAAANGIIV